MHPGITWQGRLSSEFTGCHAMAAPYVQLMLRVMLGLALAWPVMAQETEIEPYIPPGRQPAGEVVKVLPHLMDLQGRHTVSPSLFDRDAYQAELRGDPTRVSGIRYDVLWKIKGADQRPVTLRVELRGTLDGKHPRQRVLETNLPVKKSARRWTGVALTGEDYRDFGTIHAWRVSLWCDGQELAAQQSFLW
jgi:hypothetical protein